MLKFYRSLLEPLMQKLLDTELENHLEYSKYERGKNNTNSRNGYCKSKKVETKLTGFEDKCILLYAKGMSIRDIESILKELVRRKLFMLLLVLIQMDIKIY